MRQAYLRVTPGCALSEHSTRKCHGNTCKREDGGCHGWGDLARSETFFAYLAEPPKSIHGTQGATLKRFIFVRHIHSTTYPKPRHKNGIT